MRNWVFGLLIVAAMALMISEGDWFPLPNLVGSGILLVVAALVPRGEATPRPVRHPILDQEGAVGGRGSDYRRKEC